MGKRINMVMQSVFFKLSGVMPFEQVLTKPCTLHTQPMK